MQVPPPSPAPTTPIPATVNTVTINDQASTTTTFIELYGTKSGASDSLSINGKGGNDQFFVTAVGISTNLQGNDAGTVTVTPITTFYYIGWQGAGTPGVLSGINTALTIVGSNSIDTAVVDDSGDANDANYVVTPTSIITPPVVTPGMPPTSVQAWAPMVRSPTIPSSTTLWCWAAPEPTASPLRTPAPRFRRQSMEAVATTALSSTGPSRRRWQSRGYNPHRRGLADRQRHHQCRSLVITPTGVPVMGAAISYINVESLGTGNGGNDTFTLNGDAIVTTSRAHRERHFIVDGRVSDDNQRRAQSCNGRRTGPETWAITAPIKGAAAGTDLFIINGASAPLTVNGYNGTDTFKINGNASTMTINGGNGQDLVHHRGQQRQPHAQWRAAAQYLHYQRQYGPVDVNSRLGAAVYNVNNTSSPITLNSPAAGATYNLNEPLFSPVTITGTPSTLQFLILNGSSQRRCVHDH